jgi:hypothetical protein
MATQTIVIAPPGTPLTAGAHQFGPVSVPAGVFMAEVQVDAAILLSATLVVSAGFEFSQDSGATWLPGGSHELKSTGTVPLGKGGLPLTSWWGRAPLANPANPNRRVRGFVTINELVATFVRVVLTS